MRAGGFCGTDSGNGTAETKQKRKDGFSGKADFFKKTVGKKGNLGHNSAFFEKRKEEEHRKKVGYEVDDKGNSGEKSIYKNGRNRKICQTISGEHREVFEYAGKHIGEHVH